MGHAAAKDIYQHLGKKIDGLNVKVLWNETLHAILKELYSSEEADLVVRMPSSLSTIEELIAYTKLDPEHLRKLLDSLCNKGLVVDVFLNNAYYYTPSPMVIGIFEFTMMRTDKNLDVKKIAKLFSRYFSDGLFYRSNFSKGQPMGILRTVPYEKSFEVGEDYVEVLDYEKATAIVEEADTFSISLCACRHEKMHAREDGKSCNVPLDTCSSFGYSADYLIRNRLARKVSKSEMLENVARSKELGLVLNADNVKKNCQFICHCCKDCCMVLLGVSQFGYPKVIITSNYIAEWDGDSCTACGQCVRTCSVSAIKAVPTKKAGANKKNKTGGAEIEIDKSICLGCGVCVVKCNQRAMKLVRRKRRLFTPETTFEKAILKHLASGTLQDQLFANPKTINHKILCGLLGGFLKLSPVKRALMSDVLRSSFLNLLKKGVQLQGRGWLTEL